jgi:SMI1-KNR4 cell-wall
MTKVEMDRILGAILKKQWDRFDPPSPADWEVLSAKLGCTFSNDFRSFIELMAVYRFPGQIYNVSSGKTNDEDQIAVVYDMECKYPEWDPDMIPFFGIGNGDYFCINRMQCPDSPVYYRYLDRESFEEDSPSFEQWIRGLPDFLDWR